MNEYKTTPLITFKSWGKYDDTILKKNPGYEFNKNFCQFVVADRILVILKYAVCIVQISRARSLVQVKYIING